MQQAPKGSVVVVVGAGIMGTGIAHAFAVSGWTVHLSDTRAAALEDAVRTVRAILDDGVRRAKMTVADADAAAARLVVHVDLARSLDGAQVDLAIETVSESLKAKLDVVRVLDDLLESNSVIASNTSALSVTELSTATARPDRCIGMHFFNPVQKMKLVEVVRALGTSEETVLRVRAWVEQLGKEAIVVEESPGLTTSRMSALLGNEAMYMLMEGVASAEDIDAAMRGAFNHPMGPLELGDLTGWDTRLAVLKYLHETLGDKYRPCPLIAKMVRAGRLGRKSGYGVYRYVDGHKVPGSGLGGK